jgi:hypothetical protein
LESTWDQLGVNLNLNRHTSPSQLMSALVPQSVWVPHFVNT